MNELFLVYTDYTDLIFLTKYVLTKYASFCDIYITVYNLQNKVSRGSLF